MIRFVALALVSVLAFPAALPAQERVGQRGQLYQVLTWEVQPDHMQAFEAAVRKIAQAAERSDLGPAYRVRFWSDANRYTMINRVASFAYFDDPGHPLRAFAGTEGEAMVQEAWAEYENINSTEVSEEIFERKAEWSYEVEDFDFDKMKYARVDEVWLRPGPGIEEQFEELSKDWIAFFQALDYPYPHDGYEIHFGDADRIVYVTFIDDLSAYYGANAIARRWERHTLTYEPGMSYWPEEEEVPSSRGY
jgi:hypothetical protein